MIELKSKSDCCGCSACAQACPKQCISMHTDSEGFSYPSINISACVDCGLCEKVCPIINQYDRINPITTYAAYNNDYETRIKSSSGGIFRLIAEYTIKNNGIVFGARFNDKWEVVHDYTETIDGLIEFQGSKYVQSRIGDCYNKAKQFLNNNRIVLFSGTPCQIAGLHHYLNKEYDNLITVDIICHGVPSPMIWDKYHKSLSQFDYLSFRDKNNGWKDYKFIAKRQNNIIINEHRDKNIYMKLFLSDLCLRPSCYNCPSKSGKSHSDITIADFWGIETIMPDFDDDKGCSLVIINSQMGNNIFQQIDCNKIAIDHKIAIQHNPVYNSSVPEPKYRNFFFKNFDKYGFNIYNVITRKQRPSLLHRIASRCKRLIFK